MKKRSLNPTRRPHPLHFELSTTGKAAQRRGWAVSEAVSGGAKG
jgi:hypothetical protein